MKQKTTSAAVAAIVASLTASLAPVPAKSTTLPAAVEARAHRGMISAALTLDLPSGQVFLPLDEATDYLTQMNDAQRSLLNTLIKERQSKGKGGLTPNTSRLKRTCLNSLEQHTRVKEAIRIVMSPDNLAKLYPDDLESRVHYRTALIKFGRAVAAGEFILRDTISAIEQSLPPEKTVHLTDMPTDEEVRAMISAEHRNLGLSEPRFS